MTVGIDAYLQSIDGNLYDLEIANNGDIKSEDFFDSAILISLFAESRANESEVFQSHMRRGWIGNESTPNFEIGSKIWIYEQARLTRSVLNGITAAARQSLQWLIDDNYVLSIDIESILTATGVDINIIIYRPNSKIDYRYYTLWDNTGVEVPARQTYFELTVPTEDLGPTDGSRVVGYNIFDKIGNPKYAVDVIVYVFDQCGGVGSPTISTGSGWHIDSKITIYNDTNNQFLGGGGRGGDGGETSGNGGVGTGGGGGNAFGFAGTPGAYDGEYVFTPTAPYPGTPTGGNIDRIATDGEQGFPGIEMFHPITLMNNGTIAGGGGGGGGGGADGGTGGEGGRHGFQTIPLPGDDGGGTDPGLGGGPNFAIVTNGYSIIYNPEGSLRGGVS
jgi:phage gp46-like protein